MLEKLCLKEFDQIYNLMEVSFPKDEYRSYFEQKALLDHPLYQIYVQKDVNAQVVKGFLAVWDLDFFVFFEHFAVNPAYRNSGIGSKMLVEFSEMLGKMVCLEVEPPDSEMTSRRIGFYERNNFFFNEYPYTQPALSKGQNPVPLFIMTYGRPISEQEFDTIKNKLYTQVYKQF
jgi:ribosomal protein S18 acetylase RimI-like enzyme